MMVDRAALLALIALDALLWVVILALGYLIVVHL